MAASSSLCFAPRVRRQSQFTQAVVLVDPVGKSSSTGSLITTLHDKGQKLVALCGCEVGQDDFPSVTMDASFIALLTYEIKDGLPVPGAAVQAARSLMMLNVQAVLPASEQGVMMADELAAELDLPGNDPQTVASRRDKFLMQEALRAAGVRATKQLLTSSPGEAQSWRRENTTFPIIVKPILSFWQDGVHLCANDEDISNAFAQELQKVTPAGTINDQLIVQEFLAGTEYCVECVSHEGKHVLVGIETYDKRPTEHERSPVYFTVSLVDSDAEAASALSCYTFSVLDALGIREGPSHNEIMLCADGPCLIETAARLQGVNGPEMIKAAAGIGPLDLWLDVVLEGANLFRRLHSERYCYKLKQHAMWTFLVNDVAEGTLQTDLDNGGRITKLPTVIGFSPHVREGDTLKFTRNIFTSPGLVRHVGTKEQCLQDSSTIRDMEKTEMYHGLLSEDENETDDDTSRADNKDEMDAHPSSYANIPRRSTRLSYASGQNARRSSVISITEDLLVDDPQTEDLAVGRDRKPSFVKPEGMRAKIVVLGPVRGTDASMDLLSELPAGADVVAWGGTGEDFSDMVDVLAEANVLMVCHTPGVSACQLLSELLPSLPQLKWIHARSAGVDHLMCPALEEATAKGLVVSNVKGVFGPALAEYTMMACSYFAKDVQRWQRAKAAKEWDRFAVGKLRDATMGILGFGDIGREVGRLAKAYGMRVLGCRANLDMLQQDLCDGRIDELYSLSQLCELFGKSDYVVSALPLTSRTEGIVDAQVLGSAKKGSVFINIGRGQVVDEGALVKELSEGGRLRGAALDVFTSEPLPPEHPFWELPNLLMSPHNADMTDTFLQEATQQFVERSVPAFLSGESVPNQVIVSRGY